MNSNCLGDMIRNVREEKKITQSTLCRGLCSVTTLSRIEAGERVPDYMLTKALLDRLGIQSDSLEMVLYDEDFIRLEQRRLIDRLIFEGRQDKASMLLSDYERKVPKLFPFEKQYILHRRALIHSRGLCMESMVMKPQMTAFPVQGIEKKRFEEIAALLEEALSQTMELQRKKEKLYTNEEIRLNLEIQILQFFLNQYDREICRSYILNIQNLIIRIGNEQYYNTELSYVMTGAAILLAKWYCRENEPAVALQLLSIIMKMIDTSGNFKALGMLYQLKATLLEKLHEGLPLDESEKAYVEELRREAYYCLSFVEDNMVEELRETGSTKVYDSL